jgi:hypothetical protein
MSAPRTPSRSTRHVPELEPTAQQGHNGKRTQGADKPDRRIVAIVKLLARLAAEQDFLEEPNERN